MDIVSTSTIATLERATVAAPGDELLRIFIACQRELAAEIQHRIRAVRVEASSKGRPATDPELIDSEPEDDLVFVLIQMKSQVLQRIDEAVKRLDEGRYGSCLGCGRSIAQSRLRALPFAVRCKDCEQQREHQSRDRTH